MSTPLSVSSSTWSCMQSMHEISVFSSLASTFSAFTIRQLAALQRQATAGQNDSDDGDGDGDDDDGDNDGATGPPSTVNKVHESVDVHLDLVRDHQVLQPMLDRVHERGLARQDGDIELSALVGQFFARRPTLCLYRSAEGRRVVAADDLHPRRLLIKRRQHPPRPGR